MSEQRWIKAVRAIAKPAPCDNDDASCSSSRPTARGVVIANNEVCACAVIAKNQVCAVCEVCACVGKHRQRGQIGQYARDW